MKYYCFCFRDAEVAVARLFLHEHLLTSSSAIIVLLTTKSKQVFTKVGEVCGDENHVPATLRARLSFKPGREIRAILLRSG